MENPEVHCGRISFTDDLHELTGVTYSHLSYMPVMAHDPTHIEDDHFHFFGNSSLLLIHFCMNDLLPLRGRHVCTIIPNCASTCDVSEFFDAEIPNAYCRRCSILFFLMMARPISDAATRQS